MSAIDPAAHPTKQQLHDAFEWLRGISITESDPNADTAAMLMYEIAALKTQRDELLATLKDVAYMKIRGHALIDRLQFSTKGRDLMNQIMNAIAKAEGA